MLSELKKPLALALQNILYAGYDPGQELSRLYILTGKFSANCHIKPKKSLLIISFRTRPSEKMSVKTEDSVGAAGRSRCHISFFFWARHEAIYQN